MDTKQFLVQLTVDEFKQITEQIVVNHIQQNQKDKGIPENAEDVYFDINELCLFLKCSLGTIHNYKKIGLPFYRVGRKILFRKVEVLKFMNKKR